MVKPTKVVLVFGNDHEIDQVDFEAVQDSGIVTLGVNRIWKVYWPDYIYFLEPAILAELRGVTLPHKTIFLSCRYMRRQYRQSSFKAKWAVRRSSVPLRTVRTLSEPPGWADSVTWAMHGISHDIFPDHRCVFLIAGVSLLWQSKHHFWVGDDSVTNTLDETWYRERFNRFEGNFRRCAQQYECHAIHESPTLLSNFMPVMTMAQALEYYRNGRWRDAPT